MNSAYTVPAVALVAVATAFVGAFGLRISRTTSDFYVASRTVGPRLNAAAISGEYLSAASFLGIAGLVLLQGPDMLWYPVGYTAGYLVLLLFVAAPLRRSGAYTLPDFAEARLASQGVRRLAGAFVVGVGWLYLLPQLQGAGLTLAVLTGAPDALGALIVAVVVVATVAAGGMRSITFVQAFQYWLKLTALLVPALFLVLAWQGDGQHLGSDLQGDGETVAEAGPGQGEVLLDGVQFVGQRGEGSSLLHWTRRMIEIRKQNPAFGLGSYTELQSSNPAVIAFLREYKDDLVLCVNNFSRFAQPTELDLSAFDGRHPVELIGGVRFPAIGELPYLLTLAGHGFYWFRLTKVASRIGRRV